MTTPEGRVKKNIDRVLQSFPFVHAFKPVQTGLGAAGVDYHCTARLGNMALAFFIEAKKPGEEPTTRQANFLRDRKEKQKAQTFVIDDDPSIDHVTGGLDELVGWLQWIEDYNERFDANVATSVSVSTDSV